MKKTICYSIVGLLTVLGLSLAPVQSFAATKDPTLDISTTYNESDESVIISLKSSGIIELPDGKKASSQSAYKVKDNGVYSFTAEENGIKVNKSVSVVLIQSPILKSKSKNIKLEATFKDTDSGIESVRFRNDDGAWSAWENISTNSKNGTATFNWELNPVDGDGLYNVYAQFKDRAGNMTEGVAYSRVSYSPTGKFVDTAPTLALTAIEDKSSETASIKVESNADVFTPDGNFVKNGSVYQVKENGVYSFTAYLNGMEVNQSISVSSIKSEMLITKKKEVNVVTTMKDDRSSINAVRFRNNESDSWSNWKNTKSAHLNGNETFDWDLDGQGDGEKTVYAQFKDRADNVTDGAALNKIMLDSTAPEFKVDASKYYYKSDKIYFSLKDVKDKLSKERDVYVSFDNVKYQKIDKTGDSWTDLEATIPSDHLTVGEKTVYVKVDDTLGNLSASKTFKIFFDDILPSGDIAITKRNGKELGLSAYVDPVSGISEQVILTDTSEVGLSVNVADFESGMTRHKDGVGKIIIREMTDGKLVKDKEISTIPTNGKVQLDWTLEYGLEKQVDLLVVDNAGNEKRVLSQSIRMSNLQLEYFRIQNTVNPDGSPWVPIDITTTSPQAKLFAGTNVTFKIGYNLINSDKKDAEFSGKLKVKINKPANDARLEYNKEIYVNLKNPHGINLPNGDKVPYFMDSFVIPNKAPEGATVSIQGTLVATFSDGKNLKINFPRLNDSIYQEIGTIVDNIQNRIEFNQVK